MAMMGLCEGHGRESQGRSLGKGLLPGHHHHHHHDYLEKKENYQGYEDYVDYEEFEGSVKFIMIMRMRTAEA